jgi:hypothetical protein
MGNSNSNSNSISFGWEISKPFADDKYNKVKIPKFLPKKVNEMMELLPEVYSSGNSTINSIRAIMEYLGLKFEMPETELLTTVSIRDCLEAQNENIKFRIVKQQIEIIKTLIFKGHPVVFGMDFYENEDWEPSKMPYSIPNTKKRLGGLCGILVGYSDERECFLVRNCWGKEWGMNGYFMLPYEIVISENCSDFWIIDKQTKTSGQVIEIPREEVEYLSRKLNTNDEEYNDESIEPVLPKVTDETEFFEHNKDPIKKPKKTKKTKKTKEIIEDDEEDEDETMTILIQKDTTKAIDPNCLIIDE